MIETTHDRLWLGVGMLGQAVFASRFVVQWLRSEMEGRSVLPVVFWYLSLAGSSLLLVYSVHRDDIVFVLGQSCGLLIYARNLWLIRRERGAGTATERAAS